MKEIEINEEKLKELFSIDGAKIWSTQNGKEYIKEPPIIDKEKLRKLLENKTYVSINIPSIKEEEITELQYVIINGQRFDKHIERENGMPETGCLYMVPCNDNYDYGQITTEEII